MLLLLFGCAVTRPSDDNSNFLYNHKYKNELVAPFIIEDRTGIKSNDIDYVDIKKTIEKELKRGNATSTNLTSDKELKFIYHECVNTGLYPTQNKGLNFFIHLFTLGLFPMGELKKCQTDLDIINKKTDKVINHYTTTINAETGGVFYIYAFPGASIFHKMNRVNVPARKLLMEYQESIRADKYEK